MSAAGVVALARLVDGFGVLAQVKPPAGTVPGNPAAGMIDDLSDLAGACGTDPSWVCERVYEWTGSQTWAGFAEWFVAKPLTILLIVVAALLIARLVRKAISNGMARSLDPDGVHLLRRARAGALHAPAPPPNPRTEARVRSLTSVFRSLATIFVWFVAVVWILDILKIDLAPFIASAGIIGIALGFGAQNVVRDFLAGTFILLEDQLGVGDVVDIGEAKGTVEAITLRATRVRDVNGVLWHVPNGTIQRVANKSQTWARAVLDVDVDRETPYDLAQRVIQATADAMAADEAWADDFLGEPEVWGIETFTPDGYQVRLVIKTRPAAQFGVLRELRIRLLAAFEEAGVHFADDRPDLWIRDGDKAARAEAAEQAARRRAAGGLPGSLDEPPPPPGEPHPRRGDPAEAG